MDLPGDGRQFDLMQIFRPFVACACSPSTMAQSARGALIPPPVLPAACMATGLDALWALKRITMPGLLMKSNSPGNNFGARLK